MRFIVAALLGAILSIVLVIIASKHPRGNSGNGFGNGRTDPPSAGDSGRCDGDCDNCPPHYGYRYGRWYYGHGHQYGCQRHGNGGATGRTSRD